MDDKDTEYLKAIEENRRAADVVSAAQTQADNEAGMLAAPRATPGRPSKGGKGNKRGL